MRIFVWLITLLGMILITGCQQNPIEAGATLEFNSKPTVTHITIAPTQTIATPDRIDATMTKNPERVLPTQATTAVTGEVPRKLLDSIQKDLSIRTGAAVEKINVIQAQAIVWNDGSLGCPQPGVRYTQALVNGFRVILEVGDQKYDYHAAETGFFILCESGIPQILPTGTPNS